MFLAPHHRAVSAPPGDIIRAGLWARWKMDEGSGTVVPDDSGNGRDLQLFNMGPANWVGGIKHLAGALQFARSGSDYGHIGAPDITELSDSFTFSVFIRPDDLSVSAQHITARGSGSGERVFRLALTDADSVDFLLGNSSGGWGLVWFVSIPPVIEGNTYHFCYCWDGAEAVFYIDAIEIDRRDYSGTLLTNSPANHQFSGVNPASNLISSTTSDARWYNRALSPAEISSIHAGTG